MTSFLPNYNQIGDLLLNYLNAVFHAITRVMQNFILNKSNSNKSINASV